MVNRPSHRNGDPAYNGVVRGACAWLTAVAACGFAPHAGGVNDDGGTRDGATQDGPPVFLDALADAPPGQVCFGTLGLDHVCFAANQVPTGAKNVAVATPIDTGANGTCDANAIVDASNPCVIAADSITLAGTGQLHITGPRALILLATGPAGINLNSGALIDASSVTDITGAAALASCSGATAATAKGGGFGGLFTDLGGNGGDGDGDTGHGLPATILPPPTTLHGGCPGGIGGNHNNATPASGGGAVALVASKIVLDGLVAVGGDGGKAPGNANAGGDGGGAGGMVVLDAAALSGVGEVDARGGGGGEGRGGNVGVDGYPGYYFINRTLEALGGSGGSTGGDGGDGGPHGTAPTATLFGADGGAGTSTGGGGGGGGAAGVIIVTSTATSAITYTPAPR